MTVREPRVKPVAIKDLRPTQITVGFREVAEKRKRWQELAGSKGEEFLGRHMIPVVLGPKGRHYVIDHHHLVRALHEEGVRDILITVVSDLRGVHKDSFWVILDNRCWCHPYDSRGRRRGFDEIPASISELVDDPFRSLAGGLRRAGGYAKDTTPFSEFIWADFLRRQIKRGEIEKDFPAALRKALKLAKGAEAGYLPGWSGPVPA
ncbi:MAG TPA: ParB-like protein [Alphaproteobacteria bacterium]|nr:ParB-like protein [Alphaproteobacteria bacterium]